MGSYIPADLNDLDEERVMSEIPNVRTKQTPQYLLMAGVDPNRYDNEIFEIQIY